MGPWLQLLVHGLHLINTSRPSQDGRHFPDDIFKCIFLNENVLISLNISLRFELTMFQYQFR